MSTSRWSAAFTDAKLQWQANLRLRVLVWVVLGTCWVYGLLLAGDGVDALRRSALATQEEIDRLRPLSRAQVWPARLADAQAALTTLQALQWGDEAGVAGGRADPALVEAALQDWARSTAAQAGLRIRELSVVRSPIASAGGTAAASGTDPAAPQALRLRITAELGRTELLLFLAEAARHERVVLVERLLMKPATPVGTVELDLRAVIRSGPALVGAASPAAGAGANR